MSLSLRWAQLAVLTFALGGGCSEPAPGFGPRVLPPAPPDPVELWVERAEALRGLAFARPVAVRRLARSEVAERMRAEMQAAMSPGEIESYRDAYAALGVLPARTDLIALFSEIYGEQLAGRYSTHEGALYMVDSRSPGGYARETVAVHELVHALQHQHFPRTFELSERLRHNDDVVSSLSGAIEGDATFTMLGADDGDEATERDLASARAFRDGMLGDLGSDGGAIATAPLAIRLSVIVPYAHGVMLAARRYASGGNPALDALIEDAPLSTSELFSEALGEVPDTAFVRLPLDAVASALAARRCVPGHHNVAGPLSLLALFEEHGVERAEAERLALGWRGDRFVRIDCPEGAELLWLSVWSDAAAAEQFAGAYEGISREVARNAPLAGVPAARREGSRVLVMTPHLAPLAALVTGGVEVRSYARLSSWVADGCFGEGEGCPLEPPGTAPLQGLAIANPRGVWF